VSKKQSCSFSASDSSATQHAHEFDAKRDAMGLETDGSNDLILRQLLDMVTDGKIDFAYDPFYRCRDVRNALLEAAEEAE
jgi:hypothetical protein